MIFNSFPHPCVVVAVLVLVDVVVGKSIVSIVVADPPIGVNP